MANPPDDLLAHERKAMCRELAECAVVQRHYYDALVRSGFSESEAFTLTRDHHLIFQWGALSPDPGEVPPWVKDALESSEQPSNTGNVFSISKPPTSET